jgi:hypothetical protein
MARKANKIKDITARIRSMIELTLRSSWKACNRESNDWRETSLKCDEVIRQIEAEIHQLEEMTIEEPEMNSLRLVLVNFAMRHVSVLYQLNDIRTRYIQDSVKGSR